jgi:methyl-accepting chemotaxis protein
MKWFYDLKLTSKLLISFGLVATIAAFIGYVGYIGITNVKDNQDIMYNNRLVPIAELGDANQYLLTVRGNLLAALNAPSNDMRQKYLTEINSTLPKIDELIERYSATTLVKEERELLTTFKEAWGQYKPVVRNASQLISEKKNEEALSLIYGVGLQPVSESRKTLSRLMIVNQSVAKELAVKTGEEASKSLVEMLVTLLIGVVAAIGMGIFYFPHY